MKKMIITEALLGLIVWFLSFYFLDVPNIERLLLFAIGVIVPLTLYLTETKDRNGKFFKTYIISVYLFPIAAMLAYLSFFFPMGLTAGIVSIAWLIWTFLVFLYGLSRFLARGMYFMEELSIDIGLMYLALGGVWFSIFQFGFDVMEFGSIIILLTAIHFHFSAFITPIFVGLLGRVLRQRDGFLHISYRIAAIGVIVSPLGIAIGITFSRAIEFLFVVVFVICLWMYVYFTMITLRKVILPAFAYIFIVFSSGTLLFTMGLAFCYGFGRLLHVELISIPDMVWLHGLGNAFGFVFLGVIGWFLCHPPMVRNPYGIPFSKSYGQWKIGADFFSRHNLVDKSSVSYDGLVDQLNTFQQQDFDNRKVHPEIRRFYEKTLAYRLISKTYWHRGFRTLSRLYKKFSSKIEQINLPFHHEKGDLVVDSQISPLDSDKDGRQKVRAWIRTSGKTKKAVFVAAYSYHEHEKKVYLNIALPLPFGQMTGVLRFENTPERKSDGLILTSLAHSKNKGDEGIYYVTKWFTIRLPLNECFIVWVPAATPHRIKANHEMWILGIKFLTIDYTIEKN